MQGFLLIALSCLLPVAVQAAPLNTPYRRAVIEFQSGEFQQARTSLLNVLEKNGRNPEVELLLARCYYELHDWDRAASYAQNAVQIDPRSSEAHRWLGRIEGQEAEQAHSLGLAIRTRRELEKAVSLGPSNIEARRDLMEFYLQAPWILGGSKKKARWQANAIAALDPVAGALARASFDESLGKIGEAEAEYQRLLGLKPQQADAYFEAADFYADHHDPNGVDQALEAASKLDVTDMRLNYYRGVLHVLEGKHFAEAEQELESYLARAPRRSNFPSKASALTWLGRLYEHCGKPQAAVEQYEAALQMKSNMRLAREGLQRPKTRP